jgi:large subunit ribosomal protein L23
MNPKQERLTSILLGPHVSEKAARLGEKHQQVVFRVRKDADKTEVRQAVELMFDGVKVADVQIVNVHGKQKRFGARLGWRSDWKKAYVRLAPGSEINLAGEQA